MRKKGLSANRRGFVIILTLAILLLLALMAVTYITLQLTERNITRNYMDQIRAKLIAQSGVDYVFARLLEEPFNPSEAGWQAQKPIRINGADTNYSESSGSTYGQDRDVFILSVDDLNSKININDGLDNDRVKENTKRLLNSLGAIKGVAVLGDRIINSRSASGYSNINELIRVLGQADFDSIRDLVTTHAWQDPNVANPVPLSKFVLETNEYPVKYNQNIGVYRFGRGKDANGNQISSSYDPRYAPEFENPLSFFWYYHSLYGVDELNPQWIEIVSRSPVNINQAEEVVLIALLRDLKGFFVSDRARDAPAWQYSIKDNFQGFNYGPTGEFGDEIGFLYSTEAISISDAQSIATEIKNCRDNDPSYTGKWFRGQFKSWRQFNAFVDDLVQRDMVQDSRTDDFREYTLFLSVGTVRSDIALEIAHQAKADVLKANFNPNLHLNELNPDANVKTLIDKTDLIVNSTEFCFTAMGYFQIESKGFILKPSGSDNTVIANNKIEAVVKLYDAYRETNQKQFLAGNIPNAASNTNNGLTLEIGPEPTSTGAFRDTAKENEYSGYISLPTTIGVAGTALIDSSTSSTTTSPPTSTTETNTTTTVQNDTPRRGWTTTITQIIDTTTETTSLTTTTTDDLSSGSCLYASYKESFDLDYHTSGLTANVTSVNAPDNTETGAGPYVYSSQNRLCRSYRDRTGFVPSPLSYAPGDLRIDGAYAERHSGLAYSITGREFQDIGVACYWVKPWFYPEQAGKPRSYLNICDSNTAIINPRSPNSPLFFANYFFPSKNGIEEPTTPTYNNNVPGPSTYYRRNSLVFGFSDKNQFFDANGNPFNVVRAGYGQSTPCLNHNYHNHTDGYPRYTYLRSGQWIHITFQWYLKGDYWEDPELGIPPAVRIYINGAYLDIDTADMISHNDPDLYVSAAEILQETQLLHIGPAGLLSQLKDQKRNWSADSTIDEFFMLLPRSTVTTSTTTTTAITTQTITTNTMVKDNKDVVVSDNTTTSNPPPSTSTTTSTSTNADPSTDLQDVVRQSQDIYRNSRYLRSTAQEISYISRDIRDLFIKSKGAAETSIIDPPDSSSISGLDLDSPARIIGGSWTWFAEDTDPLTGQATLKNYRDYTNTTNIYPEVKVKFIKNDIEEPQEYKDDRFSNAGLEVSSLNKIQYKVIFELPQIPLDAVLLYSPVFDDITIYYSQGVQCLSYHSE